MDTSADFAKIMAASASASSTPVSATAVTMEDLDGPEAKQILGERLYPLIEVEQGSLAGKITGMLLHGLDNSELVALIDDQATLQFKIQEALAVLEAYHQTKVAPMVPAAVARTVQRAPLSRSQLEQEIEAGGKPFHSCQQLTRSGTPLWQTRSGTPLCPPMTPTMELEEIKTWTATQKPSPSLITRMDIGNRIHSSCGNAPVHAARAHNLCVKPPNVNVW